jgi:hypothetical protein
MTDISPYGNQIPQLGTGNTLKAPGKRRGYDLPQMDNFINFYHGPEFKVPFRSGNPVHFIQSVQGEDVPGKGKALFTLITEQFASPRKGDGIGKAGPGAE